MESTHISQIFVFLFFFTNINGVTSNNKTKREKKNLLQRWSRAKYYLSLIHKFELSPLLPHIFSILPSFNPVDISSSSSATNCLLLGEKTFESIEIKALTSKCRILSILVFPFEKGVRRAGMSVSNYITILIIKKSNCTDAFNWLISIAVSFSLKIP